MPMSSTSRYGLEPAPGGLALLQDLVNTRGVPAYGVRDLLATLDDTRRWYDAATRDWAEARGAVAPEATLEDRARRRLLDLRDRVGALLDGDPQALGQARVRVTAGPQGLRLEPAGTGVTWLAGAVAAEALLAQQAGELGRLKTCRNRHCPCAFYDRSRNNSRVWHDVHTCGNVANLRASRARRRTANPPASSAGAPGAAGAAAASGRS